MKLRILIACAVLLLAVPLIAQQVSVSDNHSVSFTQFQTYSWGSNNANQIQNSILVQVAQRDVETAMSEKGLQKVSESQNPDLILTAAVASGSKHPGMRGACAESAAVLAESALS